MDLFSKAVDVSQSGGRLFGGASPAMLAGAVRVPQLAFSRREQNDEPQSYGLVKDRRQTVAEADYLDTALEAAAKTVEPVLSGLGYFGTSVYDALLGRRVRAALGFATGQGSDKNRLGELFTVPVISDLVGWTSPETQVTGTDLLGGWDDPDTIADGAAGFAVEVLTDPLTYVGGVLFGAAGKGARLAKTSGHMTKLTAKLSAKMGRRVGQHEALVMAGLKDVVVVSNNNVSDLSKMSPALRKSWDDIAKGEGYKSIDEALADPATRILGGRIGTNAPLGRINKTYGTGPKSQAWLRGVDTVLGSAAPYVAPLGTTASKLFNKNSRGAETSKAHSRLGEAAQELEREAYKARLHVGEGHAVLQAAGWDTPQYREAITGAIEKAIQRNGGTPGADTNWNLPAMERDIDDIISSNMKLAGDKNWKNPKDNPQYHTLRSYLESVWKGYEDDLVAVKERALGDRTLRDLDTSYGRRSVNVLGDPKYQGKVIPTHITPDMRRRLQTGERMKMVKGRKVLYRAKEMAEDEIDKLTAEEAMKLAYGDVVDEATRYAKEQQDAGKSVYTPGTRQKVVQTSDETAIRRQDFLTNTGSGTNWISWGSMDTRVASPLADFADDLTHRTKIVYEEAMQGNGNTLKTAERIAKQNLEAAAKGAASATDTVTKGATVSVMVNGYPTAITKKMRASLKLLMAHTDDEIKAMTPQQAYDAIPAMHRIVGGVDVGIGPVAYKQKDTVVKAVANNAIEATEFRPFSPEHKWGELADIDGIDFAAGKRADDLLGVDDARRLNDWLEIERSGYLQSKEIADFLHGLDPRHPFHQKPIYLNDPALNQMAFKLAVQRTLLMSKAASRLAGDGVDIALTKHSQGPTIAKGMKNAGFHDKGIERVRVFMQDNKGEYGQAPELQAAIAKHQDLIFGENPHKKFLKDGGNTTIGKRKSYEVNPDWLEHEISKAEAKMMYGLKPGRGYTKGDARKAYLALKEEAMEKAAADARMVPGAGSGVHLRKKDLRELARQAKAQVTKVRPETLGSVIGDMAYERFVKSGKKPFRIGADVANDMKKTMEMTADPEIVRGFLAVTDKLTNMWKGPLTSQFPGYHSRNAMNIAFMDFFYGEGSQDGIVAMFKPARIKRFVQSYRMAKQLHGGETVKGISDTPFFSGTDWKDLASRIGGDAAKQSPDELATKYMRIVAMASDTTPKHATGQTAELIGRIPESVSGVAEMIPGEGKNADSFVQMFADMKGKLGDVARDIRDNGRRADFSFASPLQIRGGLDSAFGMEVAGKSNQGQGSQFLLQRAGERLGQYTEDVGRTATLLRKVLHNAADPVTAAAETNAMHVDFRSLSNFEKKFMRRLVPFYTYARKMSEYFIRDLMEHPGGKTTQMIRAINNSTGEGRSEQLIPPQLAGQMAVPLYQKGKVKAFLRPDLPVEVLNDMMSVGPDAYSTFQNTVLGWIGQMHTFPKGVLETAFGRSSFQRGRNLEDMYSRIGTKDPILNQIIMGSPISRYISTFGPRGTLFDDRKTAAEKASSILLGMPVSSIDMEKAANEAVSSAISRELRTEDGVSRAERYYAYDEEQVSERGKELLELQNSLSKRRTALRKKLKKDAERDAERSNPSGNMPFDRLLGR